MNIPRILNTEASLKFVTTLQLNVEESQKLRYKFKF
jgi:hypothetical protein